MPGRISIVPLAGLLALLLAFTSTAQIAERPLTYQIHCEGCHKADGSGLEGFVPNFVGQLSSFLHVPDGRNFIIQVPGVAQSSLSDSEIAELINWMVVAYDPAGLPENFTLYTAEEVAALRANPLSNAMLYRAAVLQQLEQDRMVAAAAGYRYTTVSAPGKSAEGETTPVSPPASFALCGACHTTSIDGAHGMGPNLRGVVGRSSGTNPGFAFSKSMQESEVVWGEDELDRFIQAPREIVPNTSMIFFGEPDAAKRKEIVEYLLTLD